jgi:CheY-like chemotaxis protein
MPETSDAWGTPELLRDLRRALRHLYDPDALRANPLARLLLIDPDDAATALRNVLTEAIQALKPASSVSRQSNAWRTYTTLSARYIQQFPQAEVARALGISERQMRRQDSLALRSLAEYLRTRYDLSFGGRRSTSERARSAAAQPEGALPPSREAELRWIQQSQASEPLRLPTLVEGLLQTVQPLADRLEVALEAQIPPALPALTIQTAPLRQALLTLLAAFVRALPGGAIAITAEAREASADRLFIRLVPRSAPEAPPFRADSLAGCLEAARELVELTGGTLQLRAAPERGAPPAAEIAYWLDSRPTVLVVDDNQDALQLVERYLAGSRFAFVGTAEPDQALALAERCAPRLIVLDIMLPGVDGWELLERLREHPNTCRIPVIVSTILPQAELALALGAAAFVQKPVSRAALLQTLEQQLDRTRSEPG